jgi:hypothetical protein
MGGVRDGNAVSARAPSLLDQSNIDDERELLAVNASIHPDGNEAQLTLHTSIGSFPFLVMHEQLSAVIAELQAAAALMLSRQSMQADDGMLALEDAFTAALKPVETFVRIDPATSDRLFLMQFLDRLPLAIRMAPEQVADSLDQLIRVTRRSAN